MKVGDSVWTARGGDAPEGSRVVVTAAEGNCLHVAPLAALPGALAQGGGSSDQG